METKTIYRALVHVNDQPHLVLMSSGARPVAVANAGVAGVEFWFETWPDQPAVRRWFQVYGTGHKVPGDAQYVGTAPRNEMGLVWHLYEIFTDWPVTEDDDGHRSW